LTERIQKNSFLFFFLVVLSLDDGWGWAACKLNPPLQKGADIEGWGGVEKRHAFVSIESLQYNTSSSTLR